MLMLKCYSCFNRAAAAAAVPDHPEVPVFEYRPIPGDRRTRRKVIIAVLIVGGVMAVILAAFVKALFFPA